MGQRNHFIHNIPTVKKNANGDDAQPEGSILIFNINFIF